MQLYVDRVRLPDGREAEREYMRHIGAVCVLPLDRDGVVHCVRQYRYPHGEVLLEIPAGKLDSKTEDRASAALRELQEETGYRCGRLTFLGSIYTSPAILDEVIGLYLAEELTQETFFQAFRSFYKFRGDSELFTWLAAIAKFTFFSYVRKNRRETDFINTDPWNSLIIGDDETDPEKIVQKEEMAAAVRKVLDKIPAKYRDVVVLRIYAELPFSEIAESLKISESSAKVLFFRAKKMLLEELKHENLV